MPAPEKFAAGAMTAPAASRISDGRVRTGP